MSDIMAFLLARVHELETVAQAAEDLLQSGPRLDGSKPGWDMDMWADGPDYPEEEYPYERHIVAWSPAFVLAECAAKRAMIELHQPIVAQYWDLNQGRCTQCVDFHADMDCENERWPCPTIRALAQPYADHPDFDPAWRD